MEGRDWLAPMHSAPGRAVALIGAALVVVSVATRCGDSVRLDPEPPATTSDDPLALLARPVSVINVPMDVPVERLLQLVEAAVPARHGDLERYRPASDGGRARVAYELERAPFRASFVDDQARLSTRISYRMRVHYPLPGLPDVESSCGMGDGPRPQLYVALVSPISIAPDWSLRTMASVAELRPASEEDEDRCRITLFGIDITEDVVEGAREYLDEHLTAIDSLAAGVDLRSRFESWWATLSEPVALSDSVWLAMRPEGIRRGRIRGTGDSVTVEVALESRPEIVIGSQPPSLPTPLPSLDSGAVVPRLELLVNALAEYSTGSRILTELLAGRTFVMSGRDVRVEGVRVFGIGSGRVAMELEVSGDLGGRLYLTGRPAIDRATGQVSVPDLDLDVATRDLLVSTVTWFATRAFREDLRTRATWPMTSAVEWLSEWLHQGLNRDLSDDLGITGEVDSVEIVGVAAFREALIVRLSARGSARLLVRR